MKNPRLLRIFRTLLASLTLVGIMLAVLGKPQPAKAGAVPSGFAEYYIPGGAEQLYQLLVDNDTAANANNLYNVITISVAGPVTIYYDHWEGGYNTGTNTNHLGAHFDEKYTAVKGDVLTFTSPSIPDNPRGTTLAACAGSTVVRSGTTLLSSSNCYDGKDYLYVEGAAISVAQAFWPATAGTVYANAWEIYPTKPYSTDYVIPVGQDLYYNQGDIGFYHVYALIQATHDGTHVWVDNKNPNTSAPRHSQDIVNLAMNRGDVTQVWDVYSGTTVHGDYPLQVQFIIGEDVVTPSQSDSRSYTAVPSSLWESSYYDPVPSFLNTGFTPSPDHTDLYIYNPTGSPLTINWQHNSAIQTPKSGSFQIPANSTRSFSSLSGQYVPTDSGVYISASTNFWVIGAVDPNNPTFNWGFSLIPPTNLTEEYFVSWAPGNSDASTKNANPVFVTPVSDNTTFYVDTSATNIAGTNYDLTFTLNRMQTYAIRDTSDYNMTGAHIWATGKFAAVWGQDPDYANGSAAGYIDAGYTILPLNQQWIDNVATWAKSANPSSISNAINQTSTFTMTGSIGAVGLNGIYITDVLPSNWTYDTGSTQITWSDSDGHNGSSTTNPTITGGVNLSWGSLGSPLIPTLNASGTITVTYTAHTTALPGSYSENTGTICGNYSGQEYCTSDSTIVVTTLPDLTLTKKNNLSGDAIVGSPFNWILEVSNGTSSGAATFSDTQVILRDNLPTAGTTPPTYPATATVTSGTIPPTGTINCTIVANLLECKASGEVRLDSGASFTVTFSATPNSPATLLNPPSGVCRVDPLSLVSESNETNNDATNTVTAVAQSHTIVKSASPVNGATVNPNDVITYTIVVTNTGGTPLNNIVVDDTLPAGTSYVPNSTTAVGPTFSAANTYLDQFTAQLYSNSYGTTSWTSTPWVETGSDTNGPATTPTWITGGRLRFDGNAAQSNLTRNVNLTGASSATLTFDTYTANTVAAGDIFAVQVSSNGGTTWNTLGYWDGSLDSLPSSSHSYDIGVYANASTQIRFYATGWTGTEYAEVDNVQISYTGVSASNITKDNAAGANPQLASGIPSTLVTSGDHFSLGPTGGSNSTLTVTYRVRVAQYPPTSISNLASTLNDQKIQPLNSNTTTHPLTTSSISGQVRDDVNGNGALGDTENGLAGAVVALWTDPNGDGNPADGVQVGSSITTTSTGSYTFSNVVIGSYVVVETNPTGYISTNDKDGTANNTTIDQVKVTLTGTANTGNDFLDYNPATIGNFVWSDTNGNGIQDGGETGINNVTVTLYASNGTTVVATTTTNASGAYSFSAPAGTYVVGYSNLPAGYVFSPAGQGGNGALDSDPNVGTGKTASFIVAAGGTNNDLDAGAYNSTTIGNFVWSDTNGNGIQDGGEVGLGGVTVNLLDSTGSSILQTTQTASDGSYSFTVAAGSYILEFVTPGGYVHSSQDQGGNDALDSDASPSTGRTGIITVTGGSPDSTVDAGFYQNASLGDFIWNDINHNGVQDGGLEVGLSGVRVYIDSNSNGSFDPGEPSVLTDSSGHYSLTGLQPGTHDVRVDTSTLPAGFGQTYDLNGALDNKASLTLTSGQTRTDLDFGYAVQPIFSDCYVWLDENGNGVKDAGEVGIPNVYITLTGTDVNGNPVSLSTYTDSDGRYSFTGLASSNASGYTVMVVTSTLPAGLSANPTYDSDGIGTPHSTNFVLNGATDHVITDFGYNWSASSDVTGNTGTGAIGDRIWNDANGNGRQDPGEAGLAGITVQLLAPGTDGLFGTSDDGITSTTTNAAGNYIFDNIAAGFYQIRIPTPPSDYNQTGDPDHFGLAAGSNDNLTTTPILLAPGDVYVNADFGYQLKTGANIIGDQVFLDANGNGTFDGGDSGLPGVSVALIYDANGDGLWQPSGQDGTPNTADDEAIIATTLTGGNGQYTFPGLPNGNYIVWVNDTLNDLNTLVQDSTPDASSDGGKPCGTCNGLSAVNVSGSGSSIQDFGYAPAGHGTGDGLIGDTIYLDANNSAAPDPGEGMGGVVVQLYNSTGTTLLASTITDENGQYFFGNLPAATYVIRVAAPAGYTNSTYPGGGSANESTVVLGSGNIDLDQDFGYRGTGTTGTIGDFIWNDLNANGVVDAGENGIDDVTVELYQDRNGNGVLDTGDALVGKTTTSAGGAYSFSGLATDDGGSNAQYLVHVSDTHAVLTGWWNSSGTAGANNNSQGDPYIVTLTSSTATSNTADFGYFNPPTGLGNFVWFDINNNGIQDGGEPGIANIPVTLHVHYANGTDVSLSTITGANGLYSFGNLLLDENLDGVGSGEPTFTVSVATPAGYSISPIHVGGNLALDSGNPAGELVSLVKGSSDLNADFGFNEPSNYGHLPVPPYTSNLFDNGGASHLSGSSYLGASVPVESDGADVATFVADSTYDNGVVPAGTWNYGTVASGNGGSETVSITCVADPCYLSAWIDWNNDGVFTGPGERIINQAVNNGANQTFTFDIPGGTAGNAVDGTFYARFRLYTDAPDTVSPNGQAFTSGFPTVGEVEDYSWDLNNGTPTPVTIAYFQAQRQGKAVDFIWSTGTETGNVGFNLYVKNGGRLTQVNSQLIPSQVIDSLNRVDYFYSAKVNGSVFYIEDVSVLGKTSRYGPYQVGQKYGAQLDADKIDWAAVQAEHANKYAARQSALGQTVSNTNPAAKAAAVTPTKTRTPTRTKTSLRTSTPTKTRTATKTLTPSKTFTPSRTRTATRTSTPTKTYTPTNTVKATATATPTPTATATDIPTATEVPVATDVAPTATEIPVATDVAPTATEIPVATEVPTDTLVPTEVPTDTLVPTEVPTDTLVPTEVPTATLVPTEVPTDTLVPTATETPTATDTPTAVPTATATPIPPSTATYNVKVSQTGITRLTYEALKSAGLDLVGVPSAQIMLSNRGQMVPVHIEDLGGTFGPGSYVEFYGEALDTIYTGTNVYTLQFSNAPAVRMVDVNAAPGSGPASASYSATVKVNNQRSYANYAPGADGWYDTDMLVYKASKSWNYTFQVDGLADASAPAGLNLVVWGVTDWPQSPDHHLVVSVNGVQVADQTFNGLVEKNMNITLPGGTLRAGANTLTLTLPGDTGVDYELISLDKYSVSYPRSYQAQGSGLSFSASGEVLNVTNLPTGNVVIYRLDAGGPVRLTNVNIQGSGGGYTAGFAGTSQLASYVVTTVEGMNAPVLEATRTSVNLDKPAQYLVIAHPDFVAGIQPLVDARQAQGLTVSVVDVNDLYAKYTYGIFDPSAIKQYIKYAAQNLGTQYVLLVGGDTYDYRNYLGTNSLSFIPSIYVSTGAVANFVPADPLYADVSGDGLPDLAIGRFPVRTTAELNGMVNKTLAYASKSYGQTAFFASDLNDGIVSFKNISNNLAAGLPGGWTVQSAHLDDIGVAAARTQLLAAMNRGTALVTFTGHSDPAVWTFSNLFNNGNAAALTNSGKPFVVVQWGCWNTYVVDPVNNYLVQAFLFSGDRGAAAVLGATTLVDSDSEQLLGSLLTPRLAIAGKPVGQALQEAKSELAKNHADLLDVLLGWTLMGDPALVIAP